MPRERSMLGMEGLLTHLRIAIVEGDEKLARDIADLCSRQNNCHMRTFNMYIGRVCLEHKYPGDLRLFEVLNQRVLMARTNANSANRSIRYIQVAVAAAKLKTNSAPFEKTFIAYHELLSTFCTENIQGECELDSNMTIQKYKDSIKVKKADLKFYTKEYSGLFEATLETLTHDKFEVVKPSVNYEIAEDDITDDMFDFSSDLVLKRAWMDQMEADGVVGSRCNVYSEMSNHKHTDYAKTLEDKLMADEKMKERHKILMGEDASETVKLIFPGTGEEFQKYMATYIKENKFYFLTKPTPLLAKLRVECRQFHAKLNTVTIENVKYECRYLKREKSGWVVQLVVPEDASSTGPVIDTYPRIHQKFTISFATFVKTEKKELKYPEASYKCPWRKVIDVSIEDKTQRWIVTEHVHNMRQMKWKIDLSDPVFCVSLLQLLVARYYFNVATTFKDIGVATVNGAKVAVVKNYFGREQPNRNHEDIWHHLLHFQVKSIEYRKQRKRKNGTAQMLEFTSSLQKNYYLNIIKRLKMYLTKHTPDYQSSAFYTWGKETYKEQFDTLYNKIIGSLVIEGDSNKRQRTDGVVSTEEEGINSQLNSRSC